MSAWAWSLALFTIREYRRPAAGGGTSAAIITVTAVVIGLQFAYPAFCWMHCAAALADGQVRRPVTPISVQADGVTQAFLDGVRRGSSGRRLPCRACGRRR